MRGGLLALLSGGTLVCRAAAEPPTDNRQFLVLDGPGDEVAKCLDGSPYAFCTVALIEPSRTQPAAPWNFDKT